MQDLAAHGAGAEEQAVLRGHAGAAVLGRRQAHGGVEQIGQFGQGQGRPGAQAQEILERPRVAGLGQEGDGHGLGMGRFHGGAYEAEVVMAASVRVPEAMSSK